MRASAPANDDRERAGADEAAGAGDGSFVDVVLRARTRTGDTTVASGPSVGPVEHVADATTSDPAPLLVTPGRRRERGSRVSGWRRRAESSPRPR